MIKRRRKRKSRVVYRSAKTGCFVAERWAKRHPTMSVAHRYRLKG